MDQKKRKLVAGIIRDLHAGLSAEEAKARVQREVGTLTSTEVTTIEQSLIDEGVSPDEIKRFCNVHALIFEASLEQTVAAEDSPSHPARAAAGGEPDDRGHRRRAARGDRAAGAGTPSAAHAPRSRELKGVDRHYALKENAIFPYLEKTRVHGAVPGHVGQAQRRAAAAAGRREGRRGRRGCDRGSPRSDVLDTLAAEVEGMIFKEENILFPACPREARARGVGRRCWSRSGRSGFPFAEPPAVDASLAETVAARRPRPSRPAWSRCRAAGVADGAGRDPRRAAGRHQLRRRRRHGAVLQPDEGHGSSRGPSSVIGRQRRRTATRRRASGKVVEILDSFRRGRARPRRLLDRPARPAGVRSGTSRCATRREVPRLPRGVAGSHGPQLAGERRLLDDWQPDAREEMTMVTRTGEGRVLDRAWWTGACGTSTGSSCPPTGAPRTTRTSCEDEKIAVVDTVWGPFADQFIENLRELVDPCPHRLRRRESRRDATTRAACPPLMRTVPRRRPSSCSPQGRGEHPGALPPRSGRRRS